MEDHRGVHQGLHYRYLGQISWWPVTLRVRRVWDSDTRIVKEEVAVVSSVFGVTHTSLLAARLRRPELTVPLCL